MEINLSLEELEEYIRAVERLNIIINLVKHEKYVDRDLVLRIVGEEVKDDGNDI